MTFTQTDFFEAAMPNGNMKMMIYHQSKLSTNRKMTPEKET